MNANVLEKVLVLVKNKKRSGCRKRKAGKPAAEAVTGNEGQGPSRIEAEELESNEEDELEDAMDDEEAGEMDEWEVKGELCKMAAAVHRWRCPHFFKL